MSRILCLVLAAAVVALPGGGAGAAVVLPSGDAPRVTHGVVIGDATAHSAVLWARADRDGFLKVQVSGGGHARVDRLHVRAADDYTGQLLLRGLKPDTEYRYRVGSNHHGSVTRGSFRTAPDDHHAERVQLAFGGDVVGQNVCRDVREGFPIMDTIRRARPDVFVGLGDMIYADNACDPLGRYGNVQVPGGFGPAAELAAFWAHWRYNRGDAASQRLLASTSYVGVWDDHEVVNDFGPLNDTRSTPPYTPGVHLLPIGLEAFLDYTPIAVAPNTPKRLYRSLRWGKHLELFVLDTRQYRDANMAADRADRPKTMLGREQLTWLKESLAASDATWKVIVSSVPMSIPTGFPPAGGRDGWANFDPKHRLRAGTAGRAALLADSSVRTAPSGGNLPHLSGAPPLALLVPPPLFDPGSGGAREGLRSRRTCGRRTGCRFRLRGLLGIRCCSARCDRRGGHELGGGEALAQLWDARGRPGRPADRRDRQHGGTDPVLADARSTIEGTAWFE
jgi:alkaline phosphatase D